MNKKFREKNRANQKKSKELRREERKANNNKGKSFEEMLAYVDENGQLSTTPPDPTKKKVLKAEDIQLGVPARSTENEEDPIHEGVISHFNEGKGFGFIRDNLSGESIFVHMSELRSPVREQDRVRFEVRMGDRGLYAVNINILS